eukprot:259937_1
MGLDLADLPLVLKHKRGELSVRNLCVALEPNPYNLGIDLAILEIKEVGWFVEITQDSFSAGASIKAIIHLFGKQLKVVGCVKGTVTKDSAAISVLGSVQFFDDGLNPFSLIGLDCIKVVKIQKILLAADMVIGAQDTSGTVCVGMIGTFIEAKVTFVIVADISTFTPAGVFFRVTNLSLGNILKAFGFKNADIPFDIKEAKFVVATVNRVYKFECFDDAMVEYIQNALDESETKENESRITKRARRYEEPIEFVRGCQIEAKINLFDIIQIECKLSLHTNGFYFKLRVDFAKHLKKQFGKLMDKVKNHLEEKKKAALKKLQDAEDKCNEALDRARRRAPWWKKPFIWLSQQFVKVGLLIAKSVCKAGFAVVNGILTAFEWVLKLVFSIIEPELFQFIIKSDKDDFNFNFETKIKFFRTFSIHIKKDFKGNINFQQLMKAIFDAYKKKQGEHQQKVEDGAKSYSESSINGARDGWKSTEAQMDKDWENMTEEEFKEKYKDELKEMENENQLDEIEKKIEEAADNVTSEATPPPNEAYENDEDTYKDDINDNDEEEEYSRKTDRIHEHYIKYLGKEIFPKPKIRKLIEQYKGDEKKVMKKLEEELTDEQKRLLNKREQTEEKKLNSDSLPQIEYVEPPDGKFEEKEDAIFEDDENKENKEKEITIIGDKKDGRSLEERLNATSTGTVIRYDGKDDDYKNKEDFIMKLKEKMNKEKEITLFDAAAIFNSLSVINNHVSEEKVYFMYLKSMRQHNNISTYVFRAMHDNNIHILNEIKVSNTSNCTINGKNIMNYVTKKENKKKN